VLLLKGAPHKRIWANRYNGLGGHVERGEDLFNATLREVREEAGLEVHDVRLVAVVHADGGDPRLGVLFFVFTAQSGAREVSASPEGTLEWHKVDELPVTEMAPDCRSFSRASSPCRAAPLPCSLRTRMTRAIDWSSVLQKINRLVGPHKLSGKYACTKAYARRGLSCLEPRDGQQFAQCHVDFSGILHRA